MRGVRVDIDQPGHDQFALSVDRFRRVAGNVRLNGGNASLSNGHIRDGIEFTPQGARSQASEVFARFRDRKSAFVMTNAVLPVAPASKLSIGNLYSIRDIPVEVWSLVASEPCE